MGTMETLYVIKKDDFWKRTARFWMKLFGINFAIGVATGIILEFEFGTNWSNYSWFVGDIFGAPLAIEGILAFFMEATFIAVMFFGWNKVSKSFHLASTWLTGIGATLSAWWILVANAWMQHPVGMTFNPETVRNEMTDFSAIAFSAAPAMKFLHTVSSAWLTGCVFVIGVSCWFLLKKREQKMAKSSIKVAAIIGIFSALFVMFTGDQSGVQMAKNQPMKLAVAEGLMDGGQNAPFSVVPGVEVPKVLSVLATHDMNGYVPGINNLMNGYTNPVTGEKYLSAEEKMAKGRDALNAFKDYKKYEKTDLRRRNAAQVVLNRNMKYFGYGYIKDKRELMPSSQYTFTYWTFRVMVGVGMLLVLVMLLVLWYGYKDRLESTRWLLHAALWSIPLVWVAGQCGWILAEVGRQPWAIQDLLPLSAAVSGVESSSVIITFFLFFILFTALLVAELTILLKAIRKGPEPILESK
jgi:cytochrome d ubiquinol oxidase subunit I